MGLAAPLSIEQDPKVLLPEELLVPFFIPPCLCSSLPLGFTLSLVEPRHNLPSPSQKVSQQDTHRRRDGSQVLRRRKLQNEWDYQVHQRNCPQLVHLEARYGFFFMLFRFLFVSRHKAQLGCVQSPSWEHRKTDIHYCFV